MRYYIKRLENGRYGLRINGKIIGTGFSSREEAMKALRNQKRLRKEPSFQTERY